MKKKNFAAFVLLVLCQVSFAQKKINITGTVTDQKNEKLVGASVYLDGTTIGVVSNKDGAFIIKNVDAGHYKLCASFMGYKKHRQEIDLQATLSDVHIKMTETSGSLGEIVITGTGTPHHLKSSPVPTEMLSSKMVENVGAPTFNELMKSASPSFDFNPNSMGSFIQLNGLGNDFIVILIDGKRVSGDIGGMNDLSRINTANIERVEVVKGASSSLYGSDAIAGVINIITKKSNRKFAIGNYSRYSGYNTIQQSNTLDFNVSKVSGHTSFSYNSSDGWQNNPYEYDSNDSLVATYAMTQTEYSNYSVAQDLNVDITKRWNVYGNVGYFENLRSQPIEEKNYGYLTTDFNYSIGSQYLFSKKSRLTFDFLSDRFDYYYHYNVDHGDFIVGSLDTISSQIRNTANLKWILKFSKQHTMTLGAEAIGETYEAEDRVEGGEAEARTLSFYGQDEMRFFEDLQIVAGLRVVSHETFGTAVTPKVSLLYALNAFNFRGTYSRGFKAPTLKELYYRYESRSSLYLGNSDLDPQTSNYMSVGIDYNNKWFSGSVSAYNNQVDGLIVYQLIETTEEDAESGITKTKQHYNVDEAQTQGIDFLFDAKLPANFTLGGGYSFVDAQDVTAGTPLEYVAQHYGNVRAGYANRWKKYDLNINLNGRIQDEKYFDDGVAAGFNLWNLTTTHRFVASSALNFTVQAGVDNMFDYVDDVPYGENRSTITPGRTFFVALRVNFAQ